ncbi:hypothetical protein DUI87_05785 [Hirundo rustica rustica]|uniref:Uncharacterized protein n=1 Tax=Hirundo rustica rustica TaxID=333673 RepID=A0A3M0KVH5_HIRRU|nr:hypothetical protein DUI87_05785 [Hirundo rustica rustica]
MNEKLSVTLQCALAAQKANGILGCIQSTADSREGWELCSMLMRPHLQCCTQLWGPQQKDMGPAGADPEKSTRIIRGLEHLSYEDRQLGFSTLEQRRLKSDLNYGLE